MYPNMMENDPFYELSGKKWLIIAIVIAIALFALFLAVKTIRATYQPPACYTPAPSPKPLPTPIHGFPPESTPSATPTIPATPAPPSSNTTSTTGAPSHDCAEQVDDIDVLTVERGEENDGCLEVYWSPSSNADRVNIYYGEYSRSIEHSVSAPNTDGHKSVCSLKNGVNYMVQIQAVKAFCSSSLSKIVDPLP